MCSSSVTHLIISILSQICQQKPACCLTSQNDYISPTMFQCIQPNCLEQLVGLSQSPYSVSRHFLVLSKELLICMLLTFSDAIVHYRLCDCTLQILLPFVTVLCHVKERQKCYSSTTYWCYADMQSIKVFREYVRFGSEYLIRCPLLNVNASAGPYANYFHLAPDR